MGDKVKRKERSGITKPIISGCVVAVKTTQFNWPPVAQTRADVRRVTTGGGEIAGTIKAQKENEEDEQDKREVIVLFQNYKF